MAKPAHLLPERTPRTRQREARMRKLFVAALATALVLIPGASAFAKTPPAKGPKKTTLSVSNQSVTEAPPNTDQITVTRGGDKTCGYSVTYTSSDGTATAADYLVGGSGTVTFTPNGNTTATIPVALNNDNIIEGNQTFNLTLNAVTPSAGCAVPVVLQSGVITITDNPDADGDGFTNGSDNCPTTAN